MAIDRIEQISFAGNIVDINTIRVRSWYDTCLTYRRSKKVEMYKQAK
jgi:hypothetical protein